MKAVEEVLRHGGAQEGAAAGEEGCAEEVGRGDREGPHAGHEELPEVAVLLDGQDVPARAEVLKPSALQQALGPSVTEEKGRCCSADDSCRGLLGVLGLVGSHGDLARQPSQALQDRRSLQDLHQEEEV